MKIDVKGAIIPNSQKWIYEWYEMESVCPGDVQAIIDKSNGETLDVYINSGGGDIFAGSEIYAALSTCPNNVNIHVVGFAGSAASVVMCAGKSEIISTAMVMVHNVSNAVCGDYHAMDKNSEILQKANKAIASAYVAKTGMTETEALKLMDKETWLTAQQAVDLGLVDGITETKVKLVASYSEQGILPPNVIEKMENSKLNYLKNKCDALMQAKFELLKMEGKNL